MPIIHEDVISKFERNIYKLQESRATSFEIVSLEDKDKEKQLISGIEIALKKADIFRMSGIDLDFRHLDGIAIYNFTCHGILFIPYEVYDKLDNQKLLEILDRFTALATASSQPPAASSASAAPAQAHARAIGYLHDLASIDEGSAEVANLLTQLSESVASASSSAAQAPALASEDYSKRWVDRTNLTQDTDRSR